MPVDVPPDAFTGWKFGEVFFDLSKWSFEYP
jgi:hypothetical protein